MSVLDKLTVKPLLYALGATLLACLALGISFWAYSVKATAKIADADHNAEGWRTLYSSANTRVSELQAANKGYGETVATLQVELKRAQDQAVVVRQQSEAAVSAAEAAKLDADKTLNTFMDRYASQVKVTSCAQALQNVEAVCPAFSGY